MIDFEAEEMEKEIKKSCCRDPKHDERQGPLTHMTEHAILITYRSKGMEYLSVRPICRECVRHRQSLNGVLSLGEAIRRRNQQRKLNARKRLRGQVRACHAGSLKRF